MIKGKPYQVPPPLCQVGEVVLFNGRICHVTASSHTHTHLAEIQGAVPNWELAHYSLDLHRRYWGDELLLKLPEDSRNPDKKPRTKRRGK